MGKMIKTTLEIIFFIDTTWILSLNLLGKFDLDNLELSISVSWGIVSERMSKILYFEATKPKNEISSIYGGSLFK